MAKFSGISDFLPAEMMRKLDMFVLRSRYVVEGFQVGMHASPLKGSSVEFTDYRQYVKGDNLRNLDWKVFGRTDRYTSSSSRRKQTSACRSSLMRAARWDTARRDG